MNANELADELENTYPFVGVMEVAATMLRQQQAEIETYKLELYDEVMLRREQKAEIEALKDKLHLTQQSLLIIEGWTK